MPQLLEPCAPPRQRDQSTFARDWANRRLRLLIGSGILGLSVLLAALAFRLKTKEGTLVVEINEPDAAVQVANDQGKIEITRRGEKGPITISVAPGKHKVKVQKDGYALITNEFEIEAGGKLVPAVRLVPLDDATTTADAAASTDSLKSPAFEKWLKNVASLPAEQQVAAVAAKLKELNPGYDGKVSIKIENGVVTELSFLTDRVTDISPVRALAKLTNLSCAGSGSGKGQLTDLSPLRSLPLRSLICNETSVSDLSPLKGMPLTALDCGGTRVSDLAPLKGMPLTKMTCAGTKVSDLSPLQGMPLTTLNCADTKVSDLSPLRGMPLKTLHFDFKLERDAEILRSIKTLEQINGKPAAEFWKDAAGQ